MKNSASLVFACATVFLCSCGKRDRSENVTRTSDTTHAVTTTTTHAATPATPEPVALMDTFVATGANVTFDARREVDLTGDGRPEILAVHAEGPRTDTMAALVSILSPTADTLFAQRFNTRLYFVYVSRSQFSHAAADSVVLNHLRALTADKSFSAGGPSARLRGASPKTGGIDRDAVRYDIKEQGVRAAMHIPAGSPLTTAALTAQEKIPVSDASIDSLIAELKSQPTYTFFAGGEVTNTIAWSNAKHRFVRIFSCC